jgi:hypothetical protein
MRPAPWPIKVSCNASPDTTWELGYNKAFPAEGLLAGWPKLAEKISGRVAYAP